MPRKNIDLSNRHNQILLTLSARLGVSQTETVQRAIEALEEKEAKREKEIGR